MNKRIRTVAASQSAGRADLIPPLAVVGLVALTVLTAALVWVILFGLPASPL